MELRRRISALEKRIGGKAPEYIVYEGTDGREHRTEFMDFVTGMVSGGIEGKRGRIRSIDLNRNANVISRNEVLFMIACFDDGYMIQDERGNWGVPAWRCD